ncbi:hypothetical protein BST96_01755 [Oceanicoccus sagamiensis]|uniref:Uncharacterized protein n=1 Tax=Oceanicoccus sagamiensis TaxID=716816 RepID=A0A1X9NBL1_9GAMM|nr:hypothetical protein BST96_01755 [Oceanicoccus sagamiensis]
MEMIEKIQTLDPRLNFLYDISALPDDTIPLGVEFYRLAGHKKGAVISPCCFNCCFNTATVV